MDRRPSDGNQQGEGRHVGSAVLVQIVRWQAKKKHKRGFATKSEARKWERDFLNQAEGSPQMSFKRFYEVYKADRIPQLKLNTWLTKAAIIEKKILPYFGDMALGDITARDIMAWQNELCQEINPKAGKPYTKTYIRTVTNQLSAILNHAVKFYGLKENPYRSVDRPSKKQPVSVDFWTKEEYLRFADAVMDKPLSFTAFELLYYTGIREGELLALTPSDFDFDRMLLHVTKSYQRLQKRDVITDPKTPKSVRSIAIPGFLADEVKEYLEGGDIGPGDRMFPVSKNYLYHEIRRGSKAAGVKSIRVHDLRRSHVSLLIDLGFSALAIADRMDHEAVDITYRYADLFPNVQVDMAKALEEGR